jgi:hypothetical protein
MTWLTYITLDRKLAALMAQRPRVDRVGWFS